MRRSMLHVVLAACRSTKANGRMEVGERSRTIFLPLRQCLGDSLLVVQELIKGQVW
jgi:hypothetical protein